MTKKSISENMVGGKFGRLIVLSRYDTNKNGRVTWNCFCECGKYSIVAGSNLRSGVTKSCGCFRREDSKKRNTKHGKSRDPLYKLWKEMVRRCENKSCENYGAIGISVCKRWKDSFENFLEDVGNRPPGTSLDRINPFGNYEPNNCRWATAREQGRNKRGYLALSTLKSIQSDFAFESVLSLPG